MWFLGRTSSENRAEHRRPLCLQVASLEGLLTDRFSGGFRARLGSPLEGRAIGHVTFASSPVPGSRICVTGLCPESNIFFVPGGAPAPPDPPWLECCRLPNPRRGGFGGRQPPQPGGGAGGREPPRDIPQKVLFCKPKPSYVCVAGCLNLVPRRCPDPMAEVRT